jgi:hypothetical protein
MGGSAGNVGISRPTAEKLHQCVTEGMVNSPRTTLRARVVLLVVGMQTSLCVSAGRYPFLLVVHRGSRHVDRGDF